MITRKKIAIFSQPLVVGGIEKVLLTLLESFQNQDEYEFTVILPYPSEWDDKIPPGIHVIYLYSKVFPLERIRKICTILLALPRWGIRAWLRSKGVRNDFSIVVAFTEWLQPITVALSGRKIGWIHVVYPEDILQKTWLKRRLTWLRRQKWQQFDRFFCVSNATKNEFVKISGCEIQSKVLYNPINGDEIKRLAKLFHVPKKHGVFRFVACGRLTYQKGFDLLIEAFAKLETESLELMIVGGGETRQFLEDMVIRLGLKNVIFSGIQDNPYPFLASANAFVCSSRFEGYGLVVAEALILGLPVLSTRCSGPEELLDFGRRGILVNTDVVSLTEGLRAIIQGVPESGPLSLETDVFGPKLTESLMREFDVVLNDSREND